MVVCFGFVVCFDFIVSSVNGQPINLYCSAVPGTFD